MPFIFEITFSPVFEIEREPGKCLCILFQFLLICQLLLKTLVRGNILFIVLAFFPSWSINFSIFHILLNKIPLVYLLNWCAEFFFFLCTGTWRRQFSQPLPSILLHPFLPLVFSEGLVTLLTKKLYLCLSYFPPLYQIIKFIFLTTPFIPKRFKFLIKIFFRLKSRMYISWRKCEWCLQWQNSSLSC